MFYGTSLMADEVEDKTITYLFTRPIRRGAVLVGKYLAYLACTIFVVLPSVMLVYLLIVPMRRQPRRLVPRPGQGPRAAGARAWPPTARCSRSSARRFKRPLLIGLIFIFGWEQAALVFPGYLKRFTVAYYLQGLVPHAMPNDNLISMVQGIFQRKPDAAGQPGGLGAHLGGVPGLGSLGGRAAGIRAGAVAGRVRPRLFRAKLSDVDIVATRAAELFTLGRSVNQYRPA